MEKLAALSEKVNRKNRLWIIFLWLLVILVLTVVLPSGDVSLSEFGTGYVWLWNLALILIFFAVAIWVWRLGSSDTSEAGDSN